MIYNLALTLTGCQVYFLQKVAMDSKTQYNRTKARIIGYLDSISDYKEVDTMARGYDKQKAYLQMKSLSMVIHMAQTLDNPSIDSIAAEAGVSRQALYDLWNKIEGKPWAEKTHKYRVIIQNKTGDLFGNHKRRAAKATS